MQTSNKTKLIGLLVLIIIVVLAWFFMQPAKTVKPVDGAINKNVAENIIKPVTPATNNSAEKTIKPAVDKNKLKLESIKYAPLPINRTANIAYLDKVANYKIDEMLENKYLIADISEKKVELINPEDNQDKITLHLPQTDDEKQTDAQAKALAEIAKTSSLNGQDPTQVVTNSFLEREPASEQEWMELIQFFSVPENLLAVDVDKLERSGRYQDEKSKKILEDLRNDQKKLINQQKQ